MDDQNVECDSVVDLWVAVSDEEDGEFYVADDAVEDGLQAAGSVIGIVPTDVRTGVTGTSSWTSEHLVASDHREGSDHRVNTASAAGRMDTDVRAGIVTHATAYLVTSST